MLISSNFVSQTRWSIFALDPKCIKPPWLVSSFSFSVLWAMVDKVCSSSFVPKEPLNPQILVETHLHPKTQISKYENPYTEQRHQTSTTESPKIRTQNTKPNIKHCTYTNPQRKTHISSRWSSAASLQSQHKHQGGPPPPPPLGENR